MRPIPSPLVALLLVAPLLAPLPVDAQPRYTLTDLGATVGGFYSDAIGVNNHGDVVGYRTVGEDSRQRAVLWDFENGSVQVHDLGTFGQHASHAGHINDVGQITIGTEIFPHNGDATGTGFLYDRRTNSATALTGVGGRYSVGSEVNASGQVSGSVIYPNRRISAARYDDGGRTVTDLGTLGGDFAAGTGINDAGDVAGYAYTGKRRGQAPVYRGFLHRGGKMIDLGAIAGDYSVAYDVNNRGQVVGMSEFDAGQPSRWRAFLWEDGVMHNLGSLMANSYAEAVNDNGEVVGRMANFLQNDYHAFVHTGGRMYDLNDLVDLPETWTLREAHHINNLGQIVGYADISPAPGIATRTAVLLTPVPEPGALVLLAGGGVLLLRRPTSGAFRPSRGLDSGTACPGGR